MKHADGRREQVVSVENVANGEAVSRFKSIKGDRFVVAVGGGGGGTGSGLLGNTSRPGWSLDYLDLVDSVFI